MWSISKSVGETKGKLLYFTLKDNYKKKKKSSHKGRTGYMHCTKVGLCPVFIDSNWRCWKPGSIVSKHSDLSQLK